MSTGTEPVRKSKRGRDRSEMILAAAASLFRRQGFHATGIDEIGAAVGVTGPAVYRHFESKQALLAAILDRSISQHQEIVETVRREALEPEAALRSLVLRSAQTLVANRDAGAVYFQEARNLNPDDYARFVRMQRLIITEWVDLLCRARPVLPEDEARIAVRAAGGLLNSVQTFSTSMDQERLATLLAEMALAAMLDGMPRGI